MRLATVDSMPRDDTGAGLTRHRIILSEEPGVILQVMLAETLLNGKEPHKEHGILNVAIAAGVTLMGIHRYAGKKGTGKNRLRAIRGPQPQSG